MMLLLLLICVAFIVVSTTRFHLHPFLALLLAALAFGVFSGMPLNQIVDSINTGFGNTLGNIGLVIILGVIIGAFLEHSGGAYALADKILRIIGTSRVSGAMAIIGYVVSIPVFADSGFVILSPLNKALTKRVKMSLAGTAIALALGLIASHTMVPPTPGPIAAAGILEADLGLVIFWGFIASSIGLIPAIIFATRYASKTFIDPNPDLTEAEIQSKMATSPGVVKSILPILIPIILIVMKSFNNYLTVFGEGRISDTINFIGTPVIALMIGLVFALFLPKKLERSMLSIDGWTGKALREAAIILMITGAGGVFGKILQNSPLSDEIGNILGTNSFGLWLPFLIAAALKTAQGSSTVAMITSASIIAPMMIPLGITSELSVALAVLSIGAGSAVVSHANDSFFWIVTQMSGMNVSTGYRLHSLGTGIFGVSAIIVLNIINLIFN